MNAIPIASRSTTGKMSETHKKMFSPRHNFINGAKKSSQVLKTDTSVKTIKRNTFTENGRVILSPVGNIRNCNQMLRNSTSVKNRVMSTGKPSNHGCVTLFDFRKLKNQTQHISRTLPQKELTLNSYQQDCHVTRWKTWIAHTPDWIFKMALDSPVVRKTENDQHDDKENCTSENEGSNSSYVTIDVEVLDTSIKTEKEDESKVPVQNIVTERKVWKDWSIQLSEDGKLLITGKSDDNVRQQSSDISSCELVDASTLKFSNGLVYELVGMPDHFTNLPYYVRNKFQCGFPSGWKNIVDLWLKYIQEGSPFDFNWSTGSNDSSLNSTFDVTASLDIINRRSSIPVISPGRPEIKDDVKRNNVSESSRATTPPRTVPESFKRPYSPRSSLISWESKRSRSRDTISPNVNVSKVSKLPVPQTDNKIALPGSAGCSSAAETKVNASDLKAKDNISKNNTVAGKTVNQEIVLHNWTPILVNGNDIKISGYIKSGQEPEIQHTSSPIEVRKSFDCFKCKSGNSYKLVGKFVDPDNTLPLEIRRKLSKGLPSQWKMMLKMWASKISE